MDVSAILNFLLIAGAIHGFVFNIATFLSRKKIEKPVLLLNLFVFFISLNNLQSWFIEKDFFATNFFLNHFTFPWYVLIVPMFYAFLVYFLGLEKRRWPFLITSLLLFILALITRTILLFGAYNHLWDGSMIKSYNLLEDAIALSYSLVLFVKSIRLLYAYQQLYPDVLKYDNLKWIKRFLQLGGIVFVFWIIAVSFNTFSSTFNPPYTYYPLRLSSSILIYWVGYQAFFHYVVLKDRIQLRGEIRKSLSEPMQESRTDIRALPKSEREEELFKKINAHILLHQRYLDPFLSLDKISEELGIGISNLSKLINQYSNKNFSDYINQLRVEESKELLGNSSFKSYTIVSIGLECGFNSKSTFYTAFKKFTGLTPTQYRKKHS